MKTLLLFNYDWDAQAHARLALQSKQAWGQLFAARGFDLFSTPSNVNLVWFDIDRFVNRLAKEAKQQQWSAVTSHNEQFGALAAALLADKMGWPGTPPAAVAACQHKLYARQVLQQVCPEANPRFMRLPAAYGEAAPDGLTYPVFVKPIKAAFSVLAKVVHSKDELHRLTRFGRYELWVIKRLVEPFERVAKRLLPLEGISGTVSTAHSMMLEEPVNASSAGQYNLDGYVCNGKMHTLGVVDAIMYPDTQAFMRFDYPSELTPEIQTRAAKIAEKFLQAIGFTHGLFNMEFFYDRANDKLTVIEFNPRMASQFADLYLRVDGIDLHAMALELAHGRDPSLLARVKPSAACATSAVYRVFDANAPHLPQHVPSVPATASLNQLRRHFPDHLFMHMPKSVSSSARDFKWLGSYRYGILHLGGSSKQNLMERIDHASALLQWPTPYEHTFDKTKHQTQPLTLANLHTNPSQPQWRLSS